MRINWESAIDGTIFEDEDSMIDYAHEQVDYVDIEDVMLTYFSTEEIFKALNDDKRLEIFDKAVEVFIENFIIKNEEEEGKNEN